MTNSLTYEMAQVADSFRRFDVDNSGKLDSKEFRYMCLDGKRAEKVSGEVVEAQNGWPCKT